MKVPTVQDLMRTKRIRTYKLYKKIHGKPMWADQPVSINLDTQNRCNLKCKYCNPQNVFVKEHSEMPLSSLVRLLDVLRENKTFIVYACAEGNGDPLLEPRFHQICELIKKKIGAKVDVFSNGTIFKNRHVLHTPYLDDIRFTISASNPELYAEVHGKPLFNEAIKTLQWVTDNKYFHQRIWINFVLFRDNVHDLANWQHLFRGYYQDVRALHLGESRTRSSQLDSSEKILTFHRKQFFDRLIKQELPCSVFHGIGVSAKGTYMQCIDLPYKYNWGHIEEIDILETYRKRLDIGLDHPGCRGCNQKNPHWRELFEKYVW
jgi:MoaA/NifB/PqqE/SkfB family radical SAM enzyme